MKRAVFVHQHERNGGVARNGKRELALNAIALEQNGASVPVETPKRLKQPDGSRHDRFRFTPRGEHRCIGLASSSIQKPTQSVTPKRNQKQRGGHREATDGRARQRQLPKISNSFWGFGGDIFFLLLRRRVPRTARTPFCWTSRWQVIRFEDGENYEI